MLTSETIPEIKGPHVLQIFSKYFVLTSAPIPEIKSHIFNKYFFWVGGARKSHGMPLSSSTGPIDACSEPRHRGQDSATPSMKMSLDIKTTEERSNLGLLH